MSNQLLKLLEQCKKQTLKVKRLPRNKRGPTTEFEKRIATSPYAAVLASPLRQCNFHRRIFPSEFLLRFGTGWHPTTQKLWAYPTVGKRHEYSGPGNYIRLGKNVLSWIENGGHKAVFRTDSILYRSDMPDLVQNRLMEHAYKLFCKYPFKRLMPLTQQIPESQNRDDYQCILLLSPRSDSSLHQMSVDDDDKYIPCYDVSTLWPQHKHDIETKVNSPEIVGLGVPRDKASVDLAIALWRCQMHLKNGNSNA